MEYFNTYKNRLFIVLTRIVNQSAQGKVFTEDEVKDMLEDTKLADDEFIKNIFGYGEKPYPIMTYDFKSMFTDKKIPANPTILEKSWLKSIIQDDFVKLFIDEDIILKLQDKLQDVEPLFTMDLKKENINDNFIKTIIKSFRFDKFIRLEFSYNGENYTKIGMPFKLNYTIRENKFKLYFYSIEDESLFYINLDNINNIKLIDINEFNIEKLDNLSKELYNKLNKFKRKIDNMGKNQFFKEKLEEQTEILRLEIIPMYDGNTVERAHFLFSMYDKKSFKMEENYILEVKYYKFDEENIIKNIMTLGVYATVLEPESVKNKIVSKILKGYNLQKNIVCK